MKIKKCIVIGFLFFSQLNGQQIKNKFAHFTEKESLPSSNINCIMQDHLGYIWIGSANGVTKYDGYEFENFTIAPNDTNFLQLPLTSSLFEDSKGYIWIGSVGGITKYDRNKNKFKLYSISNISQKYDRTLLINNMQETKNGNIICSVADYYFLDIKNGLFFIDTKSNEIKEINISNDDSTDIFFQISPLGNEKFLISGYKGIGKYDFEKNIISWYPFKKQITVTTFLQDKNNNLWLGTYNYGLIHYNIKDSTYITFPSFNKFISNDNPLIIWKIIYDQKKNILLTTNKGLIYFNVLTNQISVTEANPQNPSGLNSLDLRDILLDNSGSIWIASNGAGISKYDFVKNNFKAYTAKVDDKNSIPPGWVSSFWEYNKNEIWLQSATGSFVKFNPETETFKVMPLPKNFELFHILKTSQGKTLFAGSNGFYVVDPFNWKFEKFKMPIELKNDVVYTAIEVDNKTIWFGTVRGMYIYDGINNAITNINFKALGIGDVGSDQVNILVKDKKKNIWIGTANGLFKYDYETKLYSRIGFSKDPLKSLISQDINSLYVDNENNLWIGTWLGGLNKYDQKSRTIDAYTKNDGLPSHSVQGILGDEENNALWLSTFDGISRFDLKKKTFSNFGVDDGIHSNQFADGSALKTSGGLFIFGGSNGMTIFNPNEIQSNLIPPKVTLTDLKLFNESIQPGENSPLEKPIYETKNLTLNYDQNDIELNYFASSYIDPQKNQYAYKLENYEDDWRYVENQRSAIYPNLPPGDYVFHFKASNNNGVWNDEGVSLKIRILPPWWKTWWAYIMYFLAFVGILGGTRRFELGRRKEKENKKLLQLENERKTKELEQAKEVEKAYTELKATQAQLIHSEKMASLGELTAGIAHEIKNPLNFVNNFSEVSRELLDEMKTELNNKNIEDVIDLVEDLKQNLDKINQHGKRADSIVKGMLLHSRGTSGEKTPTDINDLLDQYVNLAYHGMRATNKEFNISIEKDYDDSLEKINVVPQDISRVFLNIINNACYAAFNKKNKADDNNFSPTLKVSTKKKNDRVEIKIGDNGNGIPSDHLDKIFQPFFTTKPSGEGTGLGLSLSYDIVTKVHNGELKVETNEGDGTVFNILLPM